MDSYLKVILLGIPNQGNFLAKAVIGLIESVSSIAIGIILFTIILKVITLPFDYFSRASMRKNSLIMEEMRPELERLQKQYANDKALYNQKMMALYKKNNYSMFGSCISLIVTLVVFGIAISAFNTASKYENSIYFYDMCQSYNEVIYKGMEVDGEYIIYNPEDKVNENNIPVPKLSLDNKKVFDKTITSNYKIYKNSDNIIYVSNKGEFSVNNENVINAFFANSEIKDAVSETVYFSVNEKGIINFSHKTFINMDLGVENSKVIPVKDSKGEDFDLTVRKSVDEGTDRKYYTLSSSSNRLSAKVYYSGEEVVYDSENYVCLRKDETISDTFGDKDVTAYIGINSDNNNYYSISSDNAYSASIINVENENVSFSVYSYSYNLNGSTFRSKDDKFDITTAYGATKEAGIFITAQTTNGYIKYKKYFTLDEEKSPVFDSGAVEYYVVGENLTGENALRCAENNYLKIDGQDFDGNNAYSFVNSIRQEMSAQTYRKSPKSFLWVKNIWEKDLPFAHPVSNTATSLDSTEGCGCKKAKTYIIQDDYDQLVARLSAEKKEPNGFFILCVISAGVSLLLQIITNKSQKSQMELQSVDGQGATTQKMMTWFMPIMMAVFSFMFTASFSIYMIISSIISIGSTVAINKIVDKRYKNKKAKKAKEAGTKPDVVRGRIYNPPVKTKEEVKKENKKKNNQEPEYGDFITGAKGKKKK